MAHDGFTHARVRAEFLGLHYTPLTFEAALGAIAARAMAGGPFAYVTSPSVGDVTALDRDPSRIAPLFAAAWLTLNASQRVARLGALTGVALPAHRPDALATSLLSRFADRHEPIAIIGEAALAAGLAARFGFANVRWSAPPRGGRDGVGEAAAFIARARARYAILACPRPVAMEIAYATALRGDATGVGLCIDAQPRRALTLADTLNAARGAIDENARLASIWRYWLLAALSERASISARSAR